MAGKLAVQAKYPTVTPNTIVAKFVPPGSGNYTTGGEPVSLAASNFTDPNLIGIICPVNLPIDVSVEMENGNGYNGQWIPGIALANGKLQIFIANGTEFSGSWATFIALTITVILRINLNYSDQ